jgi:hypothetical protein
MCHIWDGETRALMAQGDPYGAVKMVTVIVTSSFSKAVHPSTAILSELILSLRRLGMPPATTVLLAHDGPRLPTSEPSSSGEAVEQFPSAYLEYLARIRNLLPRLRACTGLELRLVLRLENGNLAGNMALAVKLVRTPFILKAEHDHIFIRPVPLMSILNDMLHDSRIKYVRFNRRRNIQINCDRGDYVSSEHKYAARAVWARHTPPPGIGLHCNYTRTPCFSDMNHVVRTQHFREMLLPLMMASPETMPETVMQRKIMQNVGDFGTFIFGSPGHASTIVHADASIHGNGELVPEVTRWVKKQVAIKSVPTDEQSVCHSSFPMKWVTKDSIKRARRNKRGGTKRRGAKHLAHYAAEASATG